MPSPLLVLEHPWMLDVFIRIVDTLRWWNGTDDDGGPSDDHT